jgi:uncharacterized protein YceK
MQRINLLIAVLLLVLSGCQSYKTPPAEQQQLARTCVDAHQQPSSQWQGCSRNRDCEQTCGMGWTCYASDGYCHDH